ncbi:hypothetical protein GH714_042166 [Hevea brasiliensis]|uniref:F-box domain-containing protein n=1 Tax=Hevea brasiliensis TaxID=3981 RepID=A0A6A6MW86_HEVBR|nr:hypothetical protein GH714_042166 [Hevea brasiliensis]
MSHVFTTWSSLGRIVTMKGLHVVAISWPIENLESEKIKPKSRKGEVEGVDLEDLPQGCIANILSFTTPLDACRLALVSKTFRAAANSDSGRNCCLRIVMKSSHFYHSLQRKSSFFSLCNNPVLMDDAKKRFQLAYLEVKELVQQQSVRRSHMLSMRRPYRRSDGWLEIELGEYFNQCGNDGEVLEISAMEVNDEKSGLIVQGIEIRPKAV